MSRKEPIDAILIDRLIQPAFDKIWHMTGVPAHLISFHAWLALTIFIIVENLAELYYEPEDFSAIDAVLLVIILTFNSLIILMQGNQYKRWKEKPFAEGDVRQMPEPRYTHSPWRFLYVVLSYTLILPPSLLVMTLDDPVAVLDGLLSLIINIGYQVGLYSFTVAPPPGPRQKKVVQKHVMAGST